MKPIRKKAAGNEETEWSKQLNLEKNQGPCEKVSVKADMEALNLIKNQKSCWTYWRNI